MHAADTNLIVRLIARDDAARVKRAEAFAASGAWVSHVVLVEVVWVLSTVYERTPDEIAATIDVLLNHRQLTLQEPEVVAAALAEFRGRPSVGFSDCLIVQTARKAGHLPVGTFDRSLGKLDGAERL